MKAPRKRAQAIAQGRGREHRLAIPLAFELAAQIGARPLDEFVRDATQLANGLTELHRAVAADGIVVALAGGFEHASSDGSLDAESILAGDRAAASLEATRRLRASLGDDVALLAGLTGPARLAAEFAAGTDASGPVFVALVKAFCDAGIDIVLVLDDDGPEDDAWRDALGTAANIARFHRAVPLLLGRPGPLDRPLTVALETPAVAGPGIVTTPGPVAADTPLTVLQAWVEAVNG